MQQLETMDLTTAKRLTIVEWKGKRSITMNNQQHLFYGQIAKWYGDRSALDVKNSCKDMFGLPILHNSSHSCESIEYVTAGLDYYKGSHERRMKLIQCISVTSLFNTAESKRYCDDMIYYFNDIGCPIKYKD